MQHPGGHCCSNPPRRRGPSAHQELCARKRLRLHAWRELVFPAPILTSLPLCHRGAGTELPPGQPDRSQRSRPAMRHHGNPQPSRAGTEQIARPTHGSAGTRRAAKSVLGRNLFYFYLMPNSSYFPGELLASSTGTLSQ